MFEKLQAILKTRLNVSVLAAALMLAGLGAVAYSQAGGIYPTVMTVYSANGSARGTIVVKARLTRFFGGRPIVAQRLQPYILRDGGSSPLGSVYTDNNGQAQLVLYSGTLPQPGTYYIGWQYDGNGIYSRPLSVSTVTVTR